MRCIDPRHRSLGQFFQDGIATPLRADVLRTSPAMGATLTGDPRDAALREALYASIPFVH
jgi:hypothetical protein